MGRIAMIDKWLRDGVDKTSKFRRNRIAIMVWICGDCGCVGWVRHSSTEQHTWMFAMEKHRQLHMIFAGSEQSTSCPQHPQIYQSFEGAFMERNLP